MNNIQNNRRDFLKKTSIVSAVSLLPLGGMNILQSKESEKISSDCVLIPTETAGPFPLDLTENSYFLRQDIKESQTGVPLNLKLKIIGVDNCLPLANARVNIWHCTKDGLYSGYSQNNNSGQAGLTYLRGYQFTNVNGEVNFKTIFPGWYTGRICHIHFQVFVSSNYSAISQLTFDLTEKNALYSKYPNIYTKGTDPLNYNTDNIFSDGYQYQVASLSYDENTEEYNSYLEVTVKGSGINSIGNFEKEALKQFQLEQNYPNPYVNHTTIPFNLNYDSNVEIELWNINGIKVYSQKLGYLLSGEHKFDLNLNNIDLPKANYIYQVRINNTNGEFMLSKMITTL